MNRIYRFLVLILLFVVIFQFFYFSYQISLIKSTVTHNADTANYRANATVQVALQTQDQINQLKDSLKSILTYMK